MDTFLQWDQVGDLGWYVAAALFAILLLIAQREGRSVEFLNVFKLGERPAKPLTAPVAPAASPARIVPKEPEGLVTYKAVPGGDLGYGLRLGGKIYSSQLLVAADDWVPFTNNGQVRSGILYHDDGLGARCPSANFKVHVAADGSGYIHITDVTSPPHYIWFEALLPRRREELFHFGQFAGPPTQNIALWPFRWK